MILIGIVVLATSIWFFDVFGKTPDDYMHVLPTPLQHFAPNLYITYKSRAHVPEKVWDGLRRFAPGYTVRFFDDAACESYIASHFHGDVLARYRQLRKGAHRADLFRYCVLWREGGLYLDIKTELLRPLPDLSREHNATVLSKVKHTIYQGWLWIPRAGDPIIGKCLRHVVSSKQRLVDSSFMQIVTHRVGYLMFTSAMFRFIQEQQGGAELVVGKNGSWHLFQERCGCAGGAVRDRYGLCCSIYDADGSELARTRYSDYPW